MKTMVQYMTQTVYLKNITIWSVAVANQSIALTGQHTLVLQNCGKKEAEAVLTELVGRVISLIWTESTIQKGILKAIDQASVATCHCKMSL